MKRGLGLGTEWPGASPAVTRWSRVTVISGQVLDDAIPFIPRGAWRAPSIALPRAAITALLSVADKEEAVESPG